MSISQTWLARDEREYRQHARPTRPESYAQIEEHIKDETRRALSEMANRVLWLIIESKRPQLTAVQIAWLVGLRLPGWESVEEITQKLHITRDGFHRGVAKIKVVLDYN